MKTRVVTFCVLSFVVLLVTGGPQAQEQPGDVAAAAGALLDDPDARAKMSATLELRLLTLSGRMTPPLSAAGGAPEGLQTPLSPGDSLVNDPGSDVGLSTTQSETSIRVNPTTGTVCSTYNDSQHYAVGSTAFAGFSRSTDDGATFVDRGGIPPGGGGSSFGDPSLVWRAVDGDFYYASLHSYGLGLWRSHDDCETFTFRSMIHTGVGDDKELMAVDNDPSSSFYGRFYVAWTDFALGARIFVTHSDDGVTWSSPVALSGLGADVQGAWPAVAPNGDVYVAWVRWNPYSSGPIDIEVVRSVDGGASFNFVTNPMTGEVNPRDPSATAYCGRPALHANSSDGIRYLPSPQLEVGTDGCLHVVYSYDPDGYAVGDTIDVFYRRSCDDGASWEPEVQLNDDATLTDQWFPTVSVSGNSVAATWYDRRLDPSGNYLFDYFLRTSADGGSTWAPSTRVSDVSSGVPVLNPNFDPIVADCYHGDYDQQVQYGGCIYTQWSDDRNIQNGHPDPDVWFDQVCLCDLGTLNGTVTDASLGDPLAGAEVAADGATDLTDSSGFYQMTLCAGDYDVTASAFGYLSQTQSGVTIAEGMETVVDFALYSAPTSTLEGTVRDATTGWPLYAEVDYGLGSTWTDPETGYYSVDLPEGFYDLEASSWVAGYEPATATVNLTFNTVQDFDLDVSDGVCLAPGYASAGAYYEDFESGAPGWTATGLWHLADASVCGDPPPDSPPTAFYYGVDAACNFNVGNNEGQLTSPLISDIDANSTLSFNHWREVEQFSGPYDRTWVEILAGGGATTVFSLSSEDPSLATWIPEGPISLAPFAGQTIRVRFNFDTGDSIANSFTGWFIDDVLIGGLCEAPSDGGLVVGNVYDVNLGDGIVDATISVDVGGSTTSEATPGDPDVDDGFYTLYVPTGAHDLTASGEGGFGTDTETVVVVDLGTVGQDFALPAGRLIPIPDRVDVFVCPEDPVTVPVRLVNAGGLDALFELRENDTCQPIPTTLQPTGPFAQPIPLVGREDLEAETTEGLQLPPAPSAPTIFGAGDVIQSWQPTANTDPWGIAADLDGNVWVADGWAASGENREYGPDGVPTGRSWPYPWNPGNGPADSAFNWNTGMLWSLDVSGDNCLHELDPSGGYTGDTICGPWGISQRGAAYDPASDTWFVGGWNERVVYHIDSDGVLLDSTTVGMAIAGMAYNPETQHLFVIENASANDVIFVLDPTDNYSLVGQFNIPFGSYSGAGLEIDCDGNLWAVEQNTDTVYQFESGETAAALCLTDVPWLSESPTSGTVLANDEGDVTFYFDAIGLEEGTTHEACVQVDNDTPYGGFFNIPVTMEVRCELPPVVSYGVEGGLPHIATLNGTPVRPADAVDASNGDLFFSAFPDVILEDIDALHVIPDGPVVFSTSTDVTQGFGGIPNIKNGDLVLWDGSEATLLFSELIGFGSTLVNIDAFSILPNGNWLLSTDLPAILGGLAFQNGDIVEYDPDEDVASLYMGLDEATIFTGTPQSNADIDALHVTEDDGSVIFSIRSNGIGRIGDDLSYGWPDVASTDLFLLDPVSGHAELFLDGAGLFDGMTRNLDAVSLVPRVTTPVPEPGRLLLLGFGIAGLLLIGRRRIRA